MEAQQQKTASGLERQVAETILQRPFAVKVGDREYTVRQPSVATLILASEAIARLDIPAPPDPKDIVRSSLAMAPYCRDLGDVVAILLLGAREVDRRVKVRQKGGKRPLFARRRTVTAREALAEEVMEEMTVEQMFNTVSEIIARMNLGRFFGLTTFLREINLLRPTKVADGTTEATASGH